MQNIDHMSKTDIAKLLEKAEGLHPFIYVDKRNPSRRVERGHPYAVPSATSSQYEKGWTDAIDYICRELFGGSYLFKENDMPCDTLHCKDCAFYSWIDFDHCSLISSLEYKDENDKVCERFQLDPFFGEDKSK